MKRLNNKLVVESMWKVPFSGGKSRKMREIKGETS
jgi:hypothetical protein